MGDTYKIFPAIGIARVGDSDEYYLAPETAGGLPILVNGGPFTAGDFRSPDGRLRRQGARFAVHRCPHGGGPSQELRPGENGVARVEWTVHLANKKPIWYQFQTIDGEDGYPSNHPLRNPGITDPAERMRMVIDPGPRTLTGPGESASFSRDSDSGGYPMTFPPADLNPYGIDTLGEIHTDTQGRLVVVGGHGRSGSMHRPAGIANYANNDGWWDDTSDGTVRATVVLDDGTTVEAAPSWVIAGPPGYAPQIANLVTLYDTMFDVAVRKMGYRPDMYNGSRWDKDYEPDFDHRGPSPPATGVGLPLGGGHSAQGPPVRLRALGRPRSPVQSPASVLLRGAAAPQRAECPDIDQHGVHDDAFPGGRRPRQQKPTLV
jgi:L-Lysine epsilon oxidase N-terminal